MRSRVAVLRTSASGNERDILVVPLNKMTGAHRTQILDAALKTKDMDNEWFLTKVRERLERCGPCLPLRLWLGACSERRYLPVELLARAPRRQHGAVHQAERHA